MNEQSQNRKRVPQPKSDKAKLAKPNDEGLSLDDLNPDITEMIEELVDGVDPYEHQPDEQHPWLELDSVSPEANTPFDVTPQRILEAMLFVGSADGQPLEAKKIASLMRGVRENEIADFVEDLNQQYIRDAAPYQIVTESGGFKMQLNDSFSDVRNRFYSEQKDADLPQRAIDVLSLVAYKQPITKAKVEELRGRNCSAVLSQLVRRKLLEIERTDEKPRQNLYRTTERFLKLFEIESLEDLPSSQQTEFSD